MRIAIAVLAALALFWTLGLLAFASRIDRSTPAPSPAKADGVVALTGASNARIIAAIKLLEQGKAKRMLVSGVNPAASRSDMRGIAKATKHLYDCCVDLGYQATDTVGNARETAQWARAYDYHSLILVTSDFHMPRALLELKASMPEAEIIPYPIRTNDLDAKHWWRSREGVRRMVVEYCKFLVILTRERVARLSPGRRAEAFDGAVSSGPEVSPGPSPGGAAP